MSAQLRWHVVDRARSTNADLVEHATADPQAWPHLSALLARQQTAGRGRSGRGWETTDLEALTFSVLLRPTIDQDRWGWLPLLTGLAVVRAISAQTPAEAGKDSSATTQAQASADHAGHAGPVLLKWPNDVVVLAGDGEITGWGRYRKVGGILAEVLPAAEGLVIGIGLNLDGHSAPVQWASTLAATGLIEASDQAPFARADGLATAIGQELITVLGHLDDGSRLRELVEPVCLTLGQQVQVDLPGEQRCTGVAKQLDDDGGLVLQTGSTQRTIYAGDVTHLRLTEAP